MGNEESDTLTEIERELEFRELVEEAPFAIVTIDSDSTVLYANLAVREVFGYDTEELVGRPLETVIPERLRSRHRSAFQQYIDSGERTIDWEYVELPGLHRSGEEVPLGISFREYEVDDKEVFTGIIRDVSAQKRRESELAERNERLDRFASIVSHDLRSPLSVAKGSLELARETGADEDFDRAVEGLERIESIVDGMLTLARRGEDIDDREPVGLDGIATTAWETVETEDATLVVETDKTLSADPERLRQLFENLFRNAVEHGSTTPDSQTGQDTVEHGSTAGQPNSEATLTVIVGDHANGFYVADDGDGLPTDLQARLFDPDVGGFGTTIVRRVVEAHGWAIESTKSESGGARFDITVE